MTRRIVLGIALVALVVAAFAGYRYWVAADDGISLATVPITRGDVVETVDATGTLQAVTTVQVGSQISGTVKALYADFNSQVRKGQVIAELDPSLLQTQVEQARATVVRLQADVERARVELEDARVKAARARELFARQLISKNDLDTAESTLKTAEAALKAAEAQVVQARASLNQNTVNLGHAVIRAPIDGIVISRNVDVGQTVAASMQAPTLFVIARDLREMQLNASIDEGDVGRIGQGQRASFRVDAYGGETFSGIVSQVRLQPVVEQNVVSYVTILDVPNPDLRLKPGMTANVTVQVARADRVLRVPNAALRFRPTPEVFASLGQEGPAFPRRPEAQGARTDSASTRSVGTSGVSGGLAGGAERGGRAVVWTLENGKLRPHRVEIGISDGTMTAVTGGDLPEGATVVTGVTTSPARQASSPAGSPLLPFGNRGRGQGRGQESGSPRGGAGRQ